VRNREISYLYSCSSEFHLRAGMTHTKVVVLASRFSDIASVDILYKKKGGFLFGWGGGKSQFTLTSVSIEEIRNGNK
jgi:hypothetical protein